MPATGCPSPPEPSWAQYTMDPADRISENEEAVKEQLPLLIFLALVSVSLYD